MKTIEQLGLLGTPRQREVATLVNKGLSHAQVAAQLGISVFTVAAHLYAYYRLMPGTKHEARYARNRLRQEVGPADKLVAKRLRKQELVQGLRYGKVWLADICRLTGLKMSTVKKYLKGPRLKREDPYGRGLPNRDQLVAQARILRADGQSEREIAKQLGISRATVRRYLDPACKDNTDYLWGNPILEPKPEPSKTVASKPKPSWGIGSL